MFFKKNADLNLDEPDEVSLFENGLGLHVCRHLFWSHWNIPKQNHDLQPLLLTQAKRILDNDKEKLLALVTWGVAPGALSMLLCSKVAFEIVWGKIDGTWFKTVRECFKTWRVQMQVFLQEALWQLGNRLVSMGKATMGMTGKFVVLLDNGSCTWTARFLWWILEGDTRVSWTKNYGICMRRRCAVPWMAMVQHGFFSLNHSQQCGQLSRTHGPRNQWDVADCLYWKCLDPTKTTEFQVLGGLRIIR